MWSFAPTLFGWVVVAALMGTGSARALAVELVQNGELDQNTAGWGLDASLMG